MVTWLNENLRRRVREVFEPRYKRPLSDLEVETIANSLTSLLETTMKFKYEQKYDQQIKQPTA